MRKNKNTDYEYSVYQEGQEPIKIESIDKPINNELTFDFSKIKDIPKIPKRQSISIEFGAELELEEIIRIEIEVKLFALLEELKDELGYCLMNYDFNVRAVALLLNTDIPTIRKALVKLIEKRLIDYDYHKKMYFVVKNK